MGCGCGLISPYEECAFLLKDFNKLVLQRKELNDKKMIDEKKKTDKKAFKFKKNIKKNLEEINKKPLNRLETQKLKQLNDLFLVLLTEESKMKKNNSKNASNNIEENDFKNEILIMNKNRIIKGRNKEIISMKNDKTNKICQIMKI